MTQFSEIPPAIPRRGSALGQKISQQILRLFGWQVSGELPELTKFVAIGAPHTSNWDFPLAMTTIFALRVNLRWMGKHTLFQGPWRRLMLWFGGIPINRSAAHGVVDQMIEQFQNNDSLILGITPEGTRAKVREWKSGFYHIAKGAGVPVVMIGLDFPGKTIKIAPPFHPTEDMAEDMRQMKAYFAGIVGKNPQ